MANNPYYILFGDEKIIQGDLVAIMRCLGNYPYIQVRDIEPVLKALEPGGYTFIKNHNKTQHIIIRVNHPGDCVLTKTTIDSIGKR